MAELLNLGADVPEMERADAILAMSQGGGQAGYETSPTSPMISGGAVEVPNSPVPGQLTEEEMRAEIFLNNRILSENPQLDATWQVKDIRQVVSPMERFVVNTLLRGRPQVVKSFLQTRGYEVRETKDGDIRLKTKGGKVGGIESEYSVWDMLEPKKWSGMVKETEQDFLDAVDEAAAAIGITAGEAAAIKGMGRYGLLVAPAVGAAANTTVEAVFRAMATKAGVPFDPDILKEAALEGAISGGVDMLAAGIPIASKMAATKFPGVVKITSAGIQKIKEFPLNFASADGLARYVSKIFVGEGGDAFTKAFTGVSSKAKKVQGLFKELNRRGWFGDLVGKEAKPETGTYSGGMLGGYSLIDAMYDKSLKMIGGKDVRLPLNPDMMVRGSLGPTIATQMEIAARELGEKAYNIPFDDVLTIAKKKLDNLKTLTPKDRDKIRQHLVAEFNSYTENKVRPGVKDLDMFGRDANELKEKITLTNLWETAAGWRRNADAYEYGVKGELLTEPERKAAQELLAESSKEVIDQAIANTSVGEAIKKSQEEYALLSQFNGVMQEIATKRQIPNAMPGDYTGSLTANQGGGFAAWFSPTNAFRKVGIMEPRETEHALRRALLGGHMYFREGYEAPLGLIFRNAPVKTSLSMAPSFIAKDIKSIDQAFKNPASWVEWTTQAVKQAVLLETTREMLGDEETRNILYGVGQNTGQGDPMTTPINEQNQAILQDALMQAEQTAQDWKEQTSKIIQTGDKKGLAIAVTALEKQYPYLVSQDNPTGAVELNGKRYITDPKDRLKLSQDIKDSGLSRTQTAKVRSSAHRGEYVEAGKAKNVSTKVELPRNDFQDSEYTTRNRVN